jgi:hypothetical protein
MGKDKHFVEEFAIQKPMRFPFCRRQQLVGVFGILRNNSRFVTFFVVSGVNTGYPAKP